MFVDGKNGDVPRLATSIELRLRAENEALKNAIARGEGFPSWKSNIARAEAAEAKVLSLTKEINSWVDKMVERDDTISALTERVKELERGQSKGFNEGYDAATRQFSPLAAPEKKPCGKCVDGIIDTRIHPGSWSTKPCPACCPPSPGKDDKTGGA